MEERGWWRNIGDRGDIRRRAGGMVMEEDIERVKNMEGYRVERTIWDEGSGRH